MTDILNQPRENIAEQIKNFRTYKEIEDERQRLLLKAKTQLDMIQKDVDNIRDSVKPAQMALSAVGKIAGVAGTSLVARGISNSLLGKALQVGSRPVAVASAGAALPNLLKGFAFHLATQYSGKLINGAMDMVGDLFKSRKQKKKARKARKKLEKQLALQPKDD